MDAAALRKLIDDLPAPLAQLAARALNARSGRDRHDAAFYLAEATVKLAASLRVGRWLDSKCDPTSDLARRLEAVALPSLGHWVSFFRDAGAALGEKDVDLGKTPVGWTAVPAFAELLVENDVASNDVAKKARTKGVQGFFDALVAYRNAVLGHGAQRSSKFYDDAADKLLGALSEVLRAPSLFGGMRLAVPQLEVDDRGKDAKSRWRELQGMVPVPLDDEAKDVRPGELYFRDAKNVVPIHPFVIYVDDRFSFLNKAKAQRAEYLDYLTSGVIEDVDASQALSGVFTKLRGKATDAAAVEEVGKTLAGETTRDEPSSGEWIGRTIEGKYRITGKLGEGGMGAVYAAEHVELPRKYAVKMILPELAKSEELVQRFRREAFAAAKLRHPNIVDVVDLGRADDGTVYMVMEHLEGQSVDALCAEGPLPLDRAVAITIETLDALAAAHDAGLVHRDLKPANLFLAKDGAGKERVKVLDFGIAKMAEGEDQAQLTKSGSILGTPLYMAPEQILSSTDVDGRADLYSLGATLFKMLTGSPPASGGSAHLVVAKVAEGKIERDPSKKRADVPEWLANVVARSLALLPSERFASAREMKDALEHRSAVAATAQPKTKSSALPIALIGAIVVGGAIYAFTRPSPPPAPAPAPALASAPASASASAEPIDTGPLTSDKIFQRYASAVVFLEITDKKGGQASGTAFAIDTKGTLVTVSHVVSVSDKVKAIYRNGAEVDNVEIVLVDAATTTSIVRADVDHPATGTVPKLTPLPLRKTDDLGVGERVLSLAYPGGTKDLTLREGTMTAKKPHPKYDWFGVSLPVAPGEGGGPVLDANGEVVGMIAASAKSMGLIVPVSAFRSLAAREKK